MTFAHFTIATRDVVATRDFFHRVLGWQPIERPGNIEMEAAWLDIAPNQQLHILHNSEFEPSPFEAEFGRHLAIFYPLDQFDSLKSRLTENGATVINARRPTPFQRFFFKDPNGYYFEVIDDAQAV